MGNENSADSPLEENESWYANDLQWINHIEVFQHKPVILKKVENRLNKLKELMVEELNFCSVPLPPGTDIEKGQIVKGENNNGFPFMSLDIPQNFSKTAMFTFRTLFWWGHYLGFALILKGDKLPNYFQSLSSVRNKPAFENIYLSVSPTPWDWRMEYFVPIADLSEQEWLEKTHLLDYMKIIRIYSTAEESFKELDWTQAGVKFWKDMMPISLA
ncbi:MAG: hypothetical protein HOG63_08420 [Nitrospina sp.]|jgi:hypothetical protein|nr:hypothetical protein [Nitrospina sp.]MBT3414999.1 hypothetical protein [Nitrospina sp.]MBT3856021.1 hypothetical protein [Nitrospina sp.]MBT4389809.1 hypothetical protein [Nitrospina sp.]MBT4621765.1 hypothetical protein [Nitrospina sp.]